MPGRRRDVMGAVVRLVKVKRPGGDYPIELLRLLEDEDGVWLYGPLGAPWSTPDDSGRLHVPLLVLLEPGRPWVAWWVDDPEDPRLEVDACLPPTRCEGGWTFVDLELDPVRHERDGEVEVEDWDEFEESVANGWMTTGDAHLARRTARELAESLETRADSWQQRGWRLLAEATGRVDPGGPG